MPWLRKLVGFGLCSAYRLRELAASALHPIPLMTALPPYGLPPKMLTIEVSNICNANCVFCAYRYHRGPKGIMPMDLFRKAIDQFVDLGGGALFITPTVGEALFDKNVEEKIAYARSFQAIDAIYLYSNCILMTRSRFETLVGAGLDHLVISMSGFNRSEYKRIFRKDFYEKVLGNLHAVASSASFARCKCEISLRTDSLFPMLRPEYARLTRLGYRIDRTVFYDHWSGRISNDDLPGCMFIRPLRKRLLPCHLLYAGPGIKPDGSMIACPCRDIEGESELRIGNLRDRSLRDVWFHGRMDELRGQFVLGAPPNMCRDCRHYYPVEVQCVMPPGDGANAGRSAWNRDSATDPG